jgi:putative iron-regulated protein
MDEAYVDYVEGDAEAGIINDTSVAIDADELLSLNQSDGEETISTGFHAIEFLLWGQDQSADGPGNRPYTDFVEGDEGTAANQDRRKEYLTIVTTLLVEQLQGLVEEWKADDAGNYRAEFASADPDEQLLRVVTGMTIQSGFETGGERLQTALDSGEQEDEHSCFSDNTHRDMVQDVHGVLNVWTGTYTRLDGDELSFPGVREVVAEKDSALAAELDDRIAESLRLAGELEPPFDQEIASDNAEGRARVEALITSLRDQAHLLEDVARAFDFDAPMAPP